MVPNKFEQHIKEQLGEREIQPSSKAWERISERLEPSGETKNKKSAWYYIAASIIGLLLVSVFYFSSENLVNSPDIQIVDSNKEELNKLPKNETSDKRDEFDVSPQLMEDKVVIKERYEKAKIVTNPKTDTLKLNAVPAIEHSIAVLETENLISKQVVQGVLPGSDEMINLKIAEVTAKVELLESKNGSLTDNEVDSLLRQAQRELLTQSLFRKQEPISAMTLLAEVEDELDPTFRDRIFETLKDKFIKARTAVANRNN